MVLVTLVALGAWPVEARAETAPATLSAPARLEVFAGAGYLSSPGGNGGALAAGLRWAATRHLGVSFDLGYGVLRSSPGVEDRWWLMPALELSVPAGRLRLDLGGGLGLAASSGYVGWPQYVAGPFDPTWAYQLVPGARAHLSASLAPEPGWQLFARLEAGTLLLGGTKIGSRVGNPNPSSMDTATVFLWIGVRWRLLEPRS